MRTAILALIAAAALGLAALAANLAIPEPLPVVDQLAPLRAEPGLVFNYGTFSMRLTDQPCPFEDQAAELESEGVPPARVYLAREGERTAMGCWAADMGGDIMTLSPGGELGTVPLERFRRELGV